MGLFLGHARRRDLGAELARGNARERIYVVEPTAEFVDDPNLTDRKFPGNPTQSYRSREPLRVTGEVAQWQATRPSACAKDHERLRAQGVEAID